MMNTTRKGDQLEKNIFNLFEREIDADLFWAKRDCCTLFRKKGYYSRDRESDIIFDLAVEIRLPASKEFSVLVLIECKNYSTPVGVADLEEFFSKIQQVSGANVKGILATTSSFQSSALAYAKSKGIGLLRYFHQDSFKWELRRSPSASRKSAPAQDEFPIKQGLLLNDFRSELYDLFGYTALGATNSLTRFSRDMLHGIKFSRRELRAILNNKSTVSRVPFIEKSDIESVASRLLEEIGHSDCEVSLERVVEVASKGNALKVNRLAYESTAPESSLLGLIDFESLEIRIFGQRPGQRGRERFTLAHELGHFLLNHRAYLSREFCFHGDLDPSRSAGQSAVPDIVRMEWQANYFAICLLMPREHVLQLFRRQLQVLDIPRKGHGELYVDNQTCNLDAYYTVTNSLKSVLGVSRSALNYRLQELGLVNDARRRTPLTMGRVIALNGLGHSIS
jgi:Zn-dependent peptidase ImmA (M78 family)